MVLTFHGRYPAGFVYVFLGMYHMTDHGANIRLAQYIFAGIYLVSLLVIFDIYRRVKKVRIVSLDSDIKSNYYSNLTTYLMIL